MVGHLIKLLHRSGFLDLLENGDLILADRGFLISEEITSRNCFLAMPSQARRKVKNSGGALSQKNLKKTCCNLKRNFIEYVIKYS